LTLMQQARVYFEKVSQAISARETHEHRMVLQLKGGSVSAR